MSEEDRELLETTDIGEYGDYNGMKVPLDLPMVSTKYNPLFEIGAYIDEMMEDEDLLDEGATLEGMINFDEIKELCDSIDVPINMEQFRKAVRMNSENLDYNGFDMIKASVDYIPEAEYKGKKVSLNKPKSGGSKKWYVYVRNPKSGNVKKVSYGSPVMTAKWNDPAARKSFAARHRCEKKKDKTIDPKRVLLENLF